MAQPCKWCEQPDAELLVSLTATGDSEYVCLTCVPGRIADLWAAYGLPELTFDVAEPEPGALAAVEADEGQVAVAPANGGARKKRPAAEVEPEPEAAPAATAPHD